VKFKTLFIAVCIFVLVLSCRSRLKPKIYQINEESRCLLDYVDSYYMDGFNLLISPKTDPLSLGTGKILITNQGGLNPDQEEIKTGLIMAVGEINYRIYVDLPPIITTGRMDLKNKSVCRIIGLYKLDDRIKHYVCREGFLKIDTVKSSRFHAQLYGKYFNYKSDSLIFEGNLNVKRKK